MKADRKEHKKINNKNNYTNKKKIIWFLIGTLLVSLFLMITCSQPSVSIISEQYKYDGEGRLICKVASDNSKTIFKYNEKGLPIEIKYPDDLVLYDYDENGNRIWMKDKTGSTEYYYDALDRLVGVIWRHSPWRLVVYDYDPWNYMTYMAIFNLQLMEQDLKYREILREFEMKFTARTQRWRDRELRFQQIMDQLKLEDTKKRERWLEYEVRYKHDILGNLNRIDTKWGSIQYFYYPDKGQIERRLPNGISTAFDYSPEGLLKSLSHRNSIGQLIAEYQYDYNAAGKVINVRELTPEGLKANGYTWDTRGYLKELHMPDGDRIRYNYDAMGNRLLKEDSSGKLRYYYDKFGRLARAGNFIYEWDRNGNLISQIERQRKTIFKYNGRSLPALIRTPNAVVHYSWDGEGNMVSRRRGDEITHYLPASFAPPGFTLAEFDKNGKLTASYLYGDILLAQQDIDSQMRYFLEDGFNSIRHITDMNGKIIGQLDFTPFGEPINIKGDIVANFRMAGERFLPEIKSYAIGGRLYEPLSGRYLTPDPLPSFMMRFDSFNKYAHGCKASGVFMEPRCNQTRKDMHIATSMEARIFPNLLDNYKNTFIIWSIGEGFEWYAKQALGELTGGVLATVIKGAVLRPFSFWTSLERKELERAKKGQPFGSLEFREDWGKSGMGMLGGALGAAINPIVSIGTALAFRTAAEGWGILVYHGGIIGWKAWDQIMKRIESLGQFYDSRMDRPFKIKKELTEEDMRSLEREARKRILGPRRRQDLYDDLRKHWILPPSPIFGGAGVGSYDPFSYIENQLGGIELTATGEFIGNLGNITGAVYDPKKECVLLLGDKDLSMPSIKADDLAVALALVFGSTPQDPQFSLDPADPRNPKGEWLRAVYIPEEIISGTSFGKALFEADWLLKQYSFGVKIDENGKLQSRNSSVQGFKSAADLSLEEQRHEYGKERWARFWIVSDDMELKEHGNSIYFDVATMLVKAKKQVPDPSSPTGLRDVDTDEPVATKFANLFTELYDDIAKESPEFERIRQLAKAVALAKWLKKESIPVDMDWVTEHVNKRKETVDRITALSVQWEKKEQKPYSNGSRVGIETFVHQVYLFGGVDLTVNPKYIPDDGIARNLQDVVSAKLAKIGTSPSFTVTSNGRTFQAEVLPITKSGQEMRNSSPSVEIDGIVYQFNDQKQVAKGVDENGNITEYAYDSNNKLKTIKISNSNGWHIIGERNGSSSVWTAADPYGHKWATYKYDQKKRETVISYDGYLERMNYDERNNIREYEVQTQKGSSIAPEIEKLVFDYDKFGNLTKIKGTGVPSINISYIEDGSKPCQITTPMTGVQYSYDTDWRIKEIKHSQGTSVSYEYDGKDLAKLYVNYQGKQAEYWFNKEGIAHSKDLLNGVVDYGYISGKLGSVKLGEYGEAKYVYDDQNRLRKILFPDGSRTEFRYRERVGRDKKSASLQMDTVEVLTYPISKLSKKLSK